MDFPGIFSLTGTAAMSISIAAFVAYLTQLLYKKLSGNNRTAEDESPLFASLENKALEQNHHSSNLVQKHQDDQEEDDEDENLPDLPDLSLDFEPRLDFNEEWSSLYVNISESNDTTLNNEDFSDFPEDLSIHEDEYRCVITPQDIASIDTDLLDTSMMSIEEDSTNNVDKNNDDEDVFMTNPENPTVNGETSPKSCHPTINTSCNRKPQTTEVEAKTQEEQLRRILQLMQQNPEMFGDTSKEELRKQATKLYCATTNTGKIATVQ